MQPTTASTRPAPLITLGEILGRGDLRLYEPGLPDPEPVTAALHRTLAEQTTCAHCGVERCSFRAFYRTGTVTDYKAYARCRSCGHTVELT